MVVSVDGFSVGSGAEQPCNLWIPFGIRLFGKGKIFPVCLRFTGKCFSKILVGFRHVELLFKNSSLIGYHENRWIEIVKYHQSGDIWSRSGLAG